MKWEVAWSVSLLKATEAISRPNFSDHYSLDIELNGFFSMFFVCFCHVVEPSIPKEQQFQEPQYFEKIAAFIEELKDQSLSEKIQLSLRTYEEFCNQKTREFF